jgi:hypothetical protein
VAEFIEVRFKGQRTEYFTWELDASPIVGEPVIVSAERGEDLGFVSAVGQTAERKCGGGERDVRQRPTPKGRGGRSTDGAGAGANP